jgi:hypothetical protein
MMEKDYQFRMQIVQTRTVKAVRATRLPKGGPLSMIHARVKDHWIKVEIDRPLSS